MTSGGGQITYYQRPYHCPTCDEVDAHTNLARTVVAKQSRTGPRTTWTVPANTVQLLEPRLNKPSASNPGTGSLIPKHAHARCGGRRADGYRCVRELVVNNVQYPSTFTGVGQVCFQTLRDGDQATYTLIRYFCNTHAKKQGFKPQSPQRFKPEDFPVPQVPPTLSEKVKKLFEDFDAKKFHDRHAAGDESSMTLSRRSMVLELQRLLMLRNAYTDYINKKPVTTELTKLKKIELKESLEVYCKAQAKLLVSRRIKEDDQQQKKLNRICGGAPDNFAWDGPSIIWENQPSPPAAETGAPATSANATTMPPVSVTDLTRSSSEQSGGSERDIGGASAQRWPSARSNSSAAPRKRKSSSESSEPVEPNKRAKQTDRDHVRFASELGL